MYSQVGRFPVPFRHKYIETILKIHSTVFTEATIGRLVNRLLGVRIVTDHTPDLASQVGCAYLRDKDFDSRWVQTNEWKGAHLASSQSHLKIG